METGQCSETKELKEKIARVAHDGRRAALGTMRIVDGSDGESLDSLLDHQEARASFHDARLCSLQIDYERRELISEWLLCAGDPEAAEPSNRERMRRGRLQLSGLLFWIVEPHDEILDGTIPWLTSYGPLSEAGTPLAEALLKRVPAGAIAWYLYFSNWNTFAYCSAQSGAFVWLE